MRTKLSLLVLFFTLITFQSYGELPFGAHAEDWTLDQVPDGCDVSNGWGPTWNLYEQLDAGKHVVIDFSAVWCGPCWSYHQSGTLETLWNDHGPDGDNSIRVFYIEADCSTNVACLCGSSGCNGSTQGNWMAGVNFPFFSPSGGDCSSVKSDYDVTYFPTLYAINADYKTVWEVGQGSVSKWETWLYESFAMEMEFDVIDDICATGEGSVDLTISGGYGNLSFLWNTGATTEDIDGLVPGNYSVTVTDQNGYFLVKTVDVGGNDDPIVIEEDVVEPTQCYGGNDGYIEISVSGGLPGYTYLWSNGESSQNVYDLEAGVYTVSVTDQYDCTETKEFTVGQPDELILNFYTEDASCSQANGAIIMWAEGGTGDDYEYSIGNGYSSQSDYYNLPAGTYTISVKDYNDCETFEEAIIDGTDAPVASAGDNKELSCNITEVQLDGTGSATGSGITYNWTTENGHIVSGETTTTPTVDAVGSYVIEVLDGGNNCLSKDTTEVLDGGGLPSIIINEPNIITCAVTTTELNASQSDNGDNYTYEWTTTDGNIVSGADQLVAVVDAAGSYLFTLTNTSTNCSSSKSVVVTADNNAPEYTVQNDTLTCIYTSAMLCVNVTSSYDSIVWTASGDNGNCITVTTPGDYEYTIYGTNGCNEVSVAHAANNAVSPVLTIQTPDVLGCGVSFATLDATGSSTGSNFSYSWTTTNGHFTSTTNEITATVDQPGIYYLEITNSDNGCVSNGQVEVQGGATMPNAAFTSSVDYNVVTLFGNTTAGATSTWETGDMTASGDTVTFSFNDNGTYNVCHYLENSCGVDTSCTDVVIDAIIALGFSDNVVNISCNGANDGSISITPNGGVGAYSIDWTGPNSTSYSDFDLSDLSAGDYSMTLTDEGNHSVTQSFTITEPAPIEVTSNVNPSTGSDGSIELEVTGGTPPYTYSWSNGSTDKNQSNLAKGEYTVVITDANGCTKELTFTIETSAVDDPDFVSRFNLYPNPAANNTKVALSFTNSLTGKISLVDMTGKIIRTYDIKGKDMIIDVDLNSISEGIYLIKLESQNQVGVRKLIKL